MVGYSPWGLKESDTTEQLTLPSLFHCDPQQKSSMQHPEGSLHHLSFPFIISTKRILLLKTSVPMYLPSLLFFPSSSHFIPKSKIHCYFKSTTNFHLDVRVLEIQTLHQAEPVNFHSGYSGSFPKGPGPEHTPQLLWPISFWSENSSSCFLRL